MLNREIDPRLNGNERAVLFSHYKSEVDKGFDLDRAGLKIPDEVKWQLINDVAVQVVDISEHLRIPLPEIGLIHGWDEKLDGYDESPEIREVGAHATLDENYHPMGIVRISPFYLKHEITKRMGIDQEMLVPLNYVLPHELFHIWQLHENFEQSAKDFNIAENEGNMAWIQTVTERQATEFGKMWLINHSTINNFSLNI